MVLPRLGCIVLGTVALVAFVPGYVCAGDLYDAAKANDAERVSALLRSGTNPNQHSPYDGALHAAAQLGSAGIVAALLSAGADIELEGFGGFHPLHTAALAGQRNIVSLLIGHGAIVDSLDNNGRTPLLILVSSAAGDIGTLKILLSAGANPNAVDGTTEFHPLDYSAMRGALDEATLLVAAGANVNAKDNNGMSALHFAISGYGHFNARPRNVGLVQFLIEHGADVNARDADGLTPLDYARRAAPNGGFLHQILRQAGAK